jgi:hypothetical protein
MDQDWMEAIERALAAAERSAFKSRNQFSICLAGILSARGRLDLCDRIMALAHDDFGKPN